MIIRFIKELKEEDISRIKESKNKANFYSVALDFSFLYKEINLPKRNRAELSKFFETSQAYSLINQKVENNSFPDAWLSSIYKNEAVRIFKEINYPNYRPCYYFKFSLIKLVDSYPNVPDNIDILLELGEKERFLPLRFMLGDLNNFSQRKNNPQRFVDFFYNRKDLYAEIREILSQNRKIIRKYTTDEFTNDLLELFSIKDALPGIEDIRDFSISPEPCSKKMIIDPIISHSYEMEERKAIGFYDNGGSFAHSVKIIILNDKELAIDFYSIVNEPDKKKIMKNPIYSKIIDEKLNKWLKNMELLVSFEEKLYEKIRTKILLENI